MSDVDPVPGAVHANPVVLQCSFTVRSRLRFGIRVSSALWQASFLMRIGPGTV